MTHGLFGINQRLASNILTSATFVLCINHAFVFNTVFYPQSKQMIRNIQQQ